MAVSPPFVSWIPTSTSFESFVKKMKNVDFPEIKLDLVNMKLNLRCNLIKYEHRVFLL